MRCADCRQDLSDATAQMSELFKRVKDIQQKAADSEVLVQEICRDIRKVCQHSTAWSAQHAAEPLWQLLIANWPCWSAMHEPTSRQLYVQ